MYIYIFIYLYWYTHIHIYIYIERESPIPKAKGSPSLRRQTPRGTWTPRHIIKQYYMIDYQFIK